MLVKEKDCYVMVKKDGRRVRLHKLKGTYRLKAVVVQHVPQGGANG